DEALSVPGRTIDPKIVLEMAVVRLATLPPLLPMDDILRRLEALGAGGLTAEPAPTAKVSPPTSGVQSDGLWQRFLARVQQAETGDCRQLASGRRRSADQDACRIGIANESMRREVARKETIARLSAIAREVLGRDVRVEVGPLPDELAGDAPLAKARRRSDETLADPMVQAAVEIFGGEVRGVRERRGS